MYHDILAGHPDTATALIGGGRSISFGQLRDRVARTAAALVAAGVQPGQPVVVLGDNDTAFATGVLAAFRSGAVACPLSPATPQSVLAERLQALQPVALVASPAAAESALANRAAGLVARIGVPAGSESSDLPSFDVPAQASSPAPESTATALVLHTSGIIGAPRAAVLNHDDIRASQRRVAAADVGVEAGTVVFSALPPTHVLGLNMALLTYLGVGATVVLQERFDAVGALDLIERYKVTSIVSVPPMWAAWLDLAGGRSDVMHSIANARTGASALHPDIAQAVHANFGVDLIQGYGLTETAGTVTLERSARLHPGSVGRPLDGVEIRLVDRGDVVESGDRGEIWIRTESIFEGYRDDPAATAEVLVADGWCRTGDIGIQDDDGSLYLVGRSKDIINVSGFNVAPAEVETILQQHPSVHEAIVVGESDTVTGERVVAYVTPSTSGGVTAVIDVDDVLAHCRRKLSGYKIPASLHVVDRLPLTAMGKRVRAQLR